MADAAFVSCGGTAARKRGGARVVVKGKRVKTVDVHAHCAVPAAVALVGRALETEALLMSSTADRIRAMDEQGIDVEALSINPYWYMADWDVASKLIQLQNETLAEMCTAQPDRFVAFATVALQHPDLAVEQHEQGVKNAAPSRQESMVSSVASEKKTSTGSVAHAVPTSDGARRRKSTRSMRSRVAASSTPSGGFTQAVSSAGRSVPPPAIPNRER